MNLSLLASMPAILFLKSMALLAVMFFYPYWALFYHHHYEYLMFASPWVLCLRKQCKLIKDLGQAEACQVTMLLSMLLSLPLGLSVPAQCVGILSAPLARLMPFYTSLMCLIIDFIQATRAFIILAALAGLLSISCLILVITSSLFTFSLSHLASLISCITAFAAALCNTVGMAVYTGERWNEPSDSQIQTTFGWSFYMGWISVILFFFTGVLSLAVHHPNYETLA